MSTVEAVATRRDLRAFQKLPWSIYRNIPQWVPPLLWEERKLLDPAKGHPFHEHAETALFLARDNGAVIGRIAACVNHLHNEAQRDKTGFFGFFEVVDDRETAQALFEAAGAWLAERGMEAMRGPASYSVNEVCALLVDGFEAPPVVMMSYNPPYYQDLIEAAGFHTVKDLVAYQVRDTDVPRAELGELASRIRNRRGLVVRSADLKHLDAELGPVRVIYNEAWAGNWGAVPMTDAEIDHFAKSLKPILKEGLALVAEIEGEAVGFALSIPDINRALLRINGRLLPFGIVRLLVEERKIDSVRTLALGIRPEYRRRGVDVVLLDEIVSRAVASGYYQSEMGWILEDNLVMRQPLDRLGGKVVKRYRFYERPI